MEQLETDGARIAYQVQGDGEPVLLIHPGGMADGFAPLLREPELASSYRLLHYHRRGYRDSVFTGAPPTIASHADDAAALLGHLKIPAAHVVGHSAGGVIALQLALDAPERVHSLALLEPALTQVPSGPTYLRQRLLPAIEHYRAGEKRTAVEKFFGGVFGPGWQSIIELAVPGAIDQAVADADTFFAAEAPAIQQWAFGSDQAAAIVQPLLYIVGTRSGPFRVEGRELLHRWLDQIEDFDLPDCTHLLQLQDPAGVAHALASFLTRHSIR